MEQTGPEPGFAKYEQILGTRGIELGLIGPRERDRLADRHILNCAVVARSQKFTDLEEPGECISQAGIIFPEPVDGHDTVSDSV